MTWPCGAKEIKYGFTKGVNKDVEISVRLEYEVGKSRDYTFRRHVKCMDTLNMMKVDSPH